MDHPAIAENRSENENVSPEIPAREAQHRTFKAGISPQQFGEGMMWGNQFGLVGWNPLGIVTQESLFGGWGWWEVYYPHFLTCEHTCARTFPLIKILQIINKKEEEKRKKIKISNIFIYIGGGPHWNHHGIERLRSCLADFGPDRNPRMDCRL